MATTSGSSVPGWRRVAAGGGPAQVGGGHAHQTVHLLPRQPAGITGRRLHKRSSRRPERGISLRVNSAAALGSGRSGHAGHCPAGGRRNHARHRRAADPAAPADVACPSRALTLNLIGGGRFRLGIGLTHALICDGMWGVPSGQSSTAAQRVPRRVAAAAGRRGCGCDRRDLHHPGQGAALPVPLRRRCTWPRWGRRLSRIADRHTAGTITFMTGPRALANHVVPALRVAAEEAGREAEVVAALPICVTSRRHQGPRASRRDLRGVRNPAVLPGDARLPKGPGAG